MGDTLTIRGVRQGATAVTVTASDPDGLSASQNVAVTVVNQPPAVADSIPAQTLVAGELVTFDLSGYFGDPDGDVLAYAAASGDTAVAAAGVEGDTLTIRGVRQGATAVTVTASDPDGLSASQNVAVTVVNQPPAVADSIPAQTLVADRAVTFDLSGYFGDPDGDVLAYAAASVDTAVAAAGVMGDTLTIRGVRQGATAVTVTASDPDGLSASQNVAVTVVNQPPAVADSIPAQTLVADRAVTFDLSGYFGDPDGDVLAYAAASGDTAVAAAGVMGDTLTIRGVRQGATAVTVTASDPDGLSASQNVAVDVEVNPDRAVLEALYRSTGGSYGSWRTHTNWLTDAPLGDWFGVSVDTLERVTGLKLYNNNLTGPIPPELGKLGSLQGLNLSDNNLTGPIPPELGKLGSLQELYLYDNDLTGSIPPELGKLGSLQWLYLYDNSLTGSIPPELGKLGSLRWLHLYDNDLTGSIPPELGKLGSLQRLRLSDNRLTGSIPPELGKLDSLRGLYLSDNRLTGSIPPELGKLGSLRGLHLRDNDLTGSIPPELGKLGSLQWLHLHDNDLTGSIPPELGKLGSLQELRLHYNDLTGSIPPELGKLASLQYLYLRYNNLTGPVPAELGKLKDLRLYLDPNAGLCVPGIQSFGTHRGSFTWCNETDIRALEALYEAAGGSEWQSDEGWLDGAVLVGGWYGVDADSLGRVTELDLADNDLAGVLPTGMGDLAGLRTLKLSDNSGLGGRLPLSLARLSALDVLKYARTELCAPVDKAFREWLDGLETHVGTGADCDALTDRDVLVALYNTTGGDSWKQDTNWLTDASLQDWFGVSVNTLGQVTRLLLHYNDLTGPIPAELGKLASLDTLYLSGNDLTGPVPAELGNLASLEWLYLAYNDLTGSIPPELGKLGSLRGLSLSGNNLTGSIPPELGKLGSLRGLSLSGNNLTGSIPPELGKLGSLRGLYLAYNDLTGSIPPELGKLGSLRGLNLYDNDLTGSIPPELGKLGSLRGLSLSYNRLTGSIPPELGKLGSLQWLYLYDNDLTGSIPPELGKLGSLQWLYLYDNDLTGSIPPELGKLGSLQWLYLYDNDLTGSIPPELGKLGSLRGLNLFRNRLTGSIPPELADLDSLWILSISYNADLSGALPDSLVSLQNLAYFHAGGTDLCAPLNSSFNAWLEALLYYRVARCDPGAAYLTQAVQSRDYPVALVEGEKALLRAFVTATNPGKATMPPVVARFYRDGREVHEVEISATSHPIPKKVAEGILKASANAEIPGRVVRPGLELVVEVDPEGTLDDSVGVVKRIPAEGRLAIDVRKLPLFDLTLIPFLWTEYPDSSLIGTVKAMAADPQNHELLKQTADLMPVGDFEAAAHAPVETDSNSGYSVLSLTGAIRSLEGGTGHWMGMLPSFSDVGGVARLSGRTSASVPRSTTIVHELGHNFSLLHAPCGSPSNVDGYFPDRRGRIGAWGYAVRAVRGFAKGLLVPPTVPDLMSYCGDPEWISDYHFSKARRYRLKSEPQERRRAPARSLLLWGGVDSTETLHLEPAFVVDAPPALPEATGDYELEGRTADGAVLFSLAFEMPRIADGGEGAGGFAYVLPIRPEWGRLASITLSGPEGDVTMDGSTDSPMAIYRDRRSGQVRAMLRGDAPRPVWAGSGFDVFRSRGIPDTH